MKLLRLICIVLCLFFCENVCLATNIFYRDRSNKDDTNYSLSRSDKNIYDNIKKYIKKERWFDAYKAEKKIENVGFRKAINTYISLNKFKSMTNMTTSEAVGLIDFNTENYFLSEFDIFNTRIENYYLNDTLKFDNVKQYFTRFKTDNINVVIKFFNDYLKSSNDTIQTKQKLINEFITRKMTFDEQEIFRKSFINIINDDVLIKRTEMMVLKNDFEYLDKNIDLINNGNYRRMFKNILEIRDDPKIISHLIKTTPKELRNNDAFLITQVRYYRKKDEDKKILDILYSIDNKKEYEKYWWLYKHIYIRELIKTKDYKEAYKLATSYNGYKNIDYIDAQWLAGWIALRFLEKYDDAYRHFSNINDIVSYPLSVSRATYWLGRTAMAKNDEETALKWYTLSSKYPTTFYGQLAHYAKYGILTKNGEEYKDFVLPSPPPITEEDRKSINENGIVKLAFLYYLYEGKRTEANNIFKELVSDILEKDGEIAELIEAIQILHDDEMIVPVSKLASYKSVFFIDNLFPILRLVKKNDPNIALIHAIIKQESGFTIQAESSVGAIGFMQIMPNTAKVLCQQMRITYNKYKLQHDPQYNIALGSFYINQLIKQFKGSKILAIASYNAGPKATNRWIKDFWDPRESKTMEDVIDWMECITYKETRNYVQRILENLVIYEYKLGI